MPAERRDRARRPCSSRARRTRARTASRPSASTAATTPARSTFQCSLDGAAVRALHLARRTTRTSACSANHTFEVRAVDISGNVDLTPATLHLVGRPAAGRRAARDDDRLRARPDDRAARARRSSSPPASAASTFECSLDGARPFARAAPSPQAPTAAWRSGAHTFTVRATDLDGNQAHERPGPGGSRPRRSPPRSTCGEVLVRSVKVLERPDRLPRQRPDHRHRRHHRRPRRPHHRRRRPRRRHPQHRLRRRHDHERHRPRVRLRRPAQPGHRAATSSRQLRVELNQEAGIGARRRRPGRPGQHDPRQHDPLQRHAASRCYSGTKNTLIRDNALGANLKDGIRLEHLERHPDRGQRDHRLRRRRGRA